MRRSLAIGLALVLLTATGMAVTQPAALRVISASPQGDLDHVYDASEVRITFSEAMVPVGEPATTVPAWLSVEPTAELTSYWSGSRTLIVSPGGTKAIPFGTRVTVRVDASAQALSGRRLAAPYAFTFTTPTARLLNADWYRANDRSTAPVIVRLQFNQPMDRAAVLSNVRVRHEPHTWTAPLLSAEERARWSAEDPGNLARYDARFAAIAAINASDALVNVRLATDWDRRRYPERPTAVVLETATVPEPGAWLRISFDDSLRGIEGTVPHPAQSTVLRLEEPFVVRQVGCAIGRCSFPYAERISFSRAVRGRALADRLSIVDATGTPATPVKIDRSVPLPEYPQFGFTPQALGVPEQPAMHRWIVRIDEPLQSADGQTLGYRYSQAIVAPHDPAYIGWDGSVWEATGGTDVQFVSRNVTRTWIGAVPISAIDIIPRLQALQSRNRPFPPATGEFRTIGLTADRHETHAVDFSPVLGGRSTGLAWAHLAAQSTLDSNDGLLTEPSRAALIQVTNLGVSVKDSPQSTLIFITRLDSAAPVPGVTVTIRNASNHVIWSGRTLADGTALAPALPMRDRQNPYALTWVVTAEHQGDLAWVASDWANFHSGSGSPVRYNLNESVPVLRGSVVTDRGVYQPGEVVQFKAFMRFDTPAGHVAAREGQEFEAVLNDGRGSTVGREKVRVNNWGSVEGQFTLPAGAPLGQYSVTLSEVRPAESRGWGSSLYGSFLVGAFRRPDFRVDLTAVASPPILGSSLEVDARARFLFGATMGPRPVRWTVRREPVISVPAAIRRRYAERDFVFGSVSSIDDPYARSLVVDQGTGSLDTEGYLRALVPVVANDGRAARLTVEAVVEGVSGQVIANRTETVMHPASIYIGLARPPFLLDANAGLPTRVVASDLDGAPVSGTTVEVALLREEWRRDATGYGTQWQRVEVPIGQWTATTTSEGASLHLPVGAGGSYVVRATARDSQGRLTRTDAAFYAFGGARGVWKFDGDRVELVPERRVWRPGESARVLVPSPWPRATALVTTEREGIRSHRTVQLTSTQDTIEVPITSADIPNVYVSVLLIKGRTGDAATANDADPGRPDYRVGHAELAVDDAEKRLAVNVRADREVYRPRDAVRVSVDVSGTDGQRRPTEVALWAVDHGLLSLTRYTIPDVARAVYADKDLQVMTQDSRARIMGRRPVTPLVVLGGLPGVAAPPPPLRVGQLGLMTSSVSASFAESMVEAWSADAETVRSDFRPLAFWLGSVSTDDSGRAARTVTLPDSLTTYRIMAIAASAQSHFGSGETEIRATQPLAMVPAFPRFLVAGDRASFGAVITNGTDKAGTAEVAIERLSGGTLIVEGQSRQTISIAAGESAPVRFDVRAVDAGTAGLRVRVRLGAETDAFEMPLRVYLPSKPVTVAAYGDTDTSAIELIAVPKRRLSNKGGLTISLASTALVGLGESAKYIDEYEYECAEPVASKALVRLLSADLDGVFGVGGPTAVAVRAAGIDALNALPKFQCWDGGFGMFTGNCQSLPYLTAYILDVMRASRGLLAPVSDGLLSRGYDYLQGQLRRPTAEVGGRPAWAATQAYMLKVLAEGGRPVQKEIAVALGEVARAPVFALSFLADALAASGDRGPRYVDVIRRLLNAMRVEADRAFVEEVDDPSLVWLWHTNVRATAVVLEGFARRGDATDLAPAMARWLLGTRQHGRWGTTHENGVALRALVAYYRAFESEPPQMTVTAAADGKVIASTKFSGRSTNIHRFTTPLERIGDMKPTPITIARTGTGRAYYTTRMQYVPEGLPAEVSRGFRISRRYVRVADDGSTAEGTTFARGDVVRVVLQVHLSHEGRFVALTDQVPAGLEPIDGAFSTTASDLARVATMQSSDGVESVWWRRGGFDHVEKHDDRVVAYATRLGQGRHELTYLARAMTAGTFDAAGSLVEAIYTPEVSARGAPARVVIR